jgi:hypothetical protein
LADVYGQFLRWTVTESAAGTLTEGNAIQTGAQSRLSGGGFLALEVHQIVGSLTIPTDAVAANATEQVIGTVSTRSSLAAHPTLNDEHCIYRSVIQVRGTTATYLPVYALIKDMPPVTNFRPPLLVSHKSLYPYVSSSSAGDAMSFNGYIFYNYVDVSGELAVEALEAFR